MIYLRVAWVNDRGEESRVHTTPTLIGLNFNGRAVCGVWIGLSFHIVPEGYGQLCDACRLWEVAQGCEP